EQRPLQCRAAVVVQEHGDHVLVLPAALKRYAELRRDVARPGGRVGGVRAGVRSRRRPGPGRRPGAGLWARARPRAPARVEFEGGGVFLVAGQIDHVSDYLRDAVGDRPVEGERPEALVGGDALTELRPVGASEGLEQGDLAAGLALAGGDRR